MNRIPLQCEDCEAKYILWNMDFPTVHIPEVRLSTVFEMRAKRNFAVGTLRMDQN